MCLDGTQLSFDGDGALDGRVASVAQRQHGRVSVAQLHALGLTASAIHARVQAGRLYRVHRGVYAVGHLAHLPWGAEAAALLACGLGAVLCHWSAAAVCRAASRVEEVHVLVEHRRRLTRPGITVHRTTSLPSSDVQVRHGLPLTSPTRTILDLAPYLSTAALERLLTESFVQRLVDRDELARRATTRIGHLLDDGAARITRSEAERRLLRLIRRAGLPEPETNVRVHGFEVDLLWRDARLIVEVDGFHAHGHRAAFERDRRRDQALHAAGYTTLRVTWRQIAEEPEALVALLVRSLPQQPPAAAPRPPRRPASRAGGRATPA